MVPGNLPSWERVVRSHAIPAADAYGIAAAAERVRAPQAQVGYRLYWMRQGFLASREVCATPDGYLVVGRHTQCDVVLDDERAVSLRHVLVRASSLDDGFPSLSVLDLRTTDGFELSDGTKQRSIVATGPLVFRVGIHAIVALPSAGRLLEALPEPQVSPPEASPPSPGAHARPSPSPPSPASPASPASRAASRAVSRITLMPASVDLSRRTSTSPFEPAPYSAGPGAEPYAYEVMLAAHDGRRAVVRLTASDVDQGVLVGRSEKCVDAGLHALLGDNVSRVHVLLVREKGACRLYDVASTNGTYAGDDRVRCLRLDDEGSTVSLLRAGGVTLHWRALRRLH